MPGKLIQYGNADMKVVSQRNGKCSTWDTFTVSENMKTQDTWFLLLISAILTQLRLVGEIWNRDNDKLICRN